MNPLSFFVQESPFTWVYTEKAKKKLGGMEGKQCGFYLPCKTSSLLQHKKKKKSKKVSVKNRLITCSMQCRGKKKWSIKLQLAMDWSLIDMSAWTESLLRKGKIHTGAPSSASERFCWPFRNTRVQTGPSQGHIPKMREAALTCSRHLPWEQSHIWY